MISITRWGKDHWSTLAYIETRVVDYNVAPNVGEVDKRHMRTNPEMHPFHAVNVHNMDTPWSPEWGTRLKNPEDVLPSHDDWDCVQDMEDTGLLQVLSAANGFIRLTPAGRKMCNAIRKHKQEGKNYHEFVPKQLPEHKNG